MTHQFQLVKNRVVPRDQRIVEAPIEGCQELVVSDIIPVDAIDQTLINSVGTALFGQVDWANYPVGTPFDAYVLRRITRSTLPGFARLYFGRAQAETDSTVPYRTETEFGDHLWNSILLGIKFIEDRNFPKSTKGPDGTDRFAAEIYRREFFIPEVTEGTLFKHEFFVSSVKFNIGQYPTPQPSHVSYEYLGVGGTFPLCLHAKLVFDAKQTAFVKYDAGTSTQSISSGTLAGQVFPATNFEDWQPYVKRHRQELIGDILYHAVKTTVFPPPQPEIIKA